LLPIGGAYRNGKLFNAERSNLGVAVPGSLRSSCAAMAAGFSADKAASNALKIPDPAGLPTAADRLVTPGAIRTTGMPIAGARVARRTS